MLRGWTPEWVFNSVWNSSRAEASNPRRNAPVVGSGAGSHRRGYLSSSRDASFRFAACSPTISSMSTAVASGLNSASAVPDAAGHFGAYGGVFVPETLIFALDQLDAEYKRAQADPQFNRDFEYYLREFV